MPTYKITGPDGRQFKITGPNKEGALAALQAQLTGSAPQPTPTPDTSMGTAFKVGEAGAIAGTQGYVADANRQLEDGPVGAILNAGDKYVAQPIANALGIDRQSRPTAQVTNQQELDTNAASVASTRDNLIADTGYQSLTTDDIDGVGSFLRYGGQKMAESAGPMAATIATGGAITPLVMSGEVNENLKDIEGLSEEDRVRLATAGGAISAVIENLGIGYLFKGVSKSALSRMGVAGVSRVLEKNGLGRLTSRVAAGVATEGLTEAAQEGVSIGAEAIGGRDFTAEDVKGRLFEAGVAGGVAGGGFRGGASIAGGVTDTLKSAPREDTPENRANTSFAQRIQRISTTGDLNGTPFNLKDIKTGSQHGVRAAMDATHTDIVGEIASEAKVLRENLAQKDTDSYDLALEKVQAQIGIKMARNKTKSVVTKDNFDALEKLVGDTKDGQKLLNLVRESQVLTELHNNEYKGGVSRFTDLALPLDNSQNGYNAGAQVARNITNPTGSLGLAVYTGGQSIPFQAGIVAAGRGIDAITGRRSRVNRFVKKNKDSAGLEIPEGFPSIRDSKRIAAELAASQKEASEAASAASKAQRKERLKQSNKQLLKDGAPPVPTSPQGTLEEATGLDNSGVAKVLRAIEANNTDQVLKEAIDSYRTSIAYGGKVAELNSLIRKVKQMTTKYPALAKQVGTPVDRPASNGSPIQTSPENYQRGIDDNKAMLQDLKGEAKADATMSKVDKAKVLEALDQLSRNLGTDPAGKINEIMGTLKGVEPAAVAKYVEPYVARVMGQQSAPPRSSQPVQGRPPEVAEVKPQAAIVNAAIEIGKEGGQFENGIKDIAGVRLLAEATNIVLKLYNSTADMQATVPDVVDNALGAYQQRPRIAHIVQTGGINELLTALHETLHGVAVSSAQTGNYLGELNTQNGLTDLPDVYGINSIEAIFDTVLGRKKDDPTRRQVLAELKHIQERGEFTSNGDSIPIRGAQSSAASLAAMKRHYKDIGRTDFDARRAEIQRELKDQQNYERSIGELTVDAIIMYSNDPKGMKRVAPASAKMIRGLFRQYGNKQIQFYSHPLAMGVAAVMAILAKSQAPEEEEQQQMPAGALSPQLGMLSA